MDREHIMFIERHGGVRHVISDGGELVAIAADNAGGGVCFRKSSPAESVVFDVLRILDRDDGGRYPKRNAVYATSR